MAIGHGVRGAAVIAVSVVLSHVTPTARAQKFVIEAATPEACQIVANGNCVTTGARGSGHNERCTIRTTQDLLLERVLFDVEFGPNECGFSSCTCDYLQVGATRYCGSASSFPATLSVAANTRLTWHTDGATESPGWLLCERVSTQPTLQVQSASPAAACILFGGGRCATTGTGVTGHNERCTISTLTNVTMIVDAFHTEFSMANGCGGASCTCDYLALGGNRYCGNVGPAGVDLESGAQITWFTDPATVSNGWFICAEPVTSTAAFEIVSRQPNDACTTTNGRTCITTGPGQYGPSERCTIRVLQNMQLDVSRFDVELLFTTECQGHTCDCDWFAVGGARYCGTVGPSLLSVRTGTILDWHTDTGVFGQGFMICAIITPTEAPTRAPMRVPTDQPTLGGVTLPPAPLQPTPIGGAPVTIAPSIVRGAVNSSKGGGGDFPIGIVVAVFIVLLALCILAVILRRCKRNNSPQHGSAILEMQPVPLVLNPMHKLPPTKRPLPPHGPDNGPEQEYEAVTDGYTLPKELTEKSGSQGTFHNSEVLSGVYESPPATVTGWADGYETPVPIREQERARSSTEGYSVPRDLVSGASA